MESEFDAEIDAIDTRVRNLWKRARMLLSGDVVALVEEFLRQPSRERSAVVARAIYWDAPVELLPENEMMDLARLVQDLRTVGYLATRFHELAEIEFHEETVDLSEPLSCEYENIARILQQASDSVLPCLACSLQELVELESFSTSDAITADAIAQLADRVHLIPQLLQARWALATGWLRDCGPSLKHHRGGVLWWDRTTS